MTMSRNPTHPPQDFAVQFFLTYVTEVGRSFESTRGFLEFVRPALATERHDSALSAAVNAIAIKVWTILGRTRDSSSLSIQLFGQALLRLKEALNDPKEQYDDSTVLAALVLQAHDTISAVFCQHKARGTHRDGALALLWQRDGALRASKYYANLVGNLLHSKVSFCIRERIPLPSKELAWIKTKVIPIVPINPSSLLDVIGISIVKLQVMSYELHPVDQQGSTPIIEELCTQIRTVEAQLQVWLEGIPEYWHPKRVQSGNDIDPSIQTYYGACDIYPSIQIANIWNTWRTYRIILEQIKFRLAIYSNSNRIQNVTTNNDHISAANQVQLTGKAQALVDSICYSVPFYLGNCTSPDILSNIENPPVCFPSYHDLHPNDEAFLRYKFSHDYVSRFDHSRHVLLHGPLHITSIISHLISLFDRPYGFSVTRPLQQEKRHWIAQQFLRSLYLIRLISDVPTSEPTHIDGKFQSRPTTDHILQAQLLASQMRSSLWTMNIV